MKHICGPRTQGLRTEGPRKHRQAVFEIQTVYSSYTHLTERLDHMLESKMNKRELP